LLLNQSEVVHEAIINNNKIEGLDKAFVHSNQMSLSD